ncbi:aldehyde dehydrogenase family protein [Kangiella sp. TOML190]|uniref:aldehyde dehydrogenase family protein n=1 Tax=Kangiella sp. TOML190 TaxID=2931351 RepID=UPI0020411154|nr:aldehyde dehydrogenase family protein [Kangiella sp. TOML190]
MKAQEAFNQLDPQKWANTSIPERLSLLEQVRDNLKIYADDLAVLDGKMKNELMGEKLYSHPESKIGTAVPIAGNLTASIHLYESLARGEMLQPKKVTQIDDNTYDIEVFPQETKDKVLYGTQKGHLRVKGKPTQVSPMDKEAGVIAVLGAGNYSSALEMVKALFYDNKTVIHKPHSLNEATDQVWAKVFQPLIEHGAISFCDADQGQELTKLEGISQIYFTGGAQTAKAIMSATDTPLVSECGGNNPCIVVPGDKPWSDKEIEHQAIQIATVAKMNGGAVCGRPQTLVTSKQWPQRQQFLDALRKAIVEDTPAAGTYYPGSDAVMQGFKDAYPNAEVLQPESGKYQTSDFLLITDVDEDGYAVHNEAFCQVIDEVPLDVAATASEFLPKATEFCNEKLHGSLGCMLIIDDKTQKSHQASLDMAINDLQYGGIAVNTIPPFVFLSPYLTWGGNEHGKELVSGSGNFGNLLGYKNIEKSVLYDKFMSPGHMMRISQQAFDNMANGMARYAMEPSWMNLTKMVGGAIVDSFKKKDF